jgi:hypothetical protein
MSIARGSYPRKIRGSDRKMFRNVDVAAMCQKALGAAYGEEKSVHKTIAEDTGMSPSAAENWTAGENPMSLTAFLNAYHNNDAFKAWARKLLLMESEVDPEFEAEMARFARAAAAKFGGGG